MGITTGNPIASSQRDLTNFYNRFSVIQRDTTRNLLTMEDKRTHKEYLLRELTTNDETQRRDLEQLVMQKTSLRNKYVVQLEDYLFEKQKSYCSNQFKAYLLFEAPYKTLKEEMLSRRLNNLKQFQEDELYSIVESGVLGLKHLYDINHPHEAVSSANIFMNNEGIIMLSDPWLNNDNVPHVLHNHVYPSPEKLEVLNNLRADRQDWFASDLFSLGLVVLETANMEFMDDLYVRNNKELNYAGMEARIREVKHPSIKGMLEVLLQRNERRRLDILLDFQAKFPRQDIIQHSPSQQTSFIPVNPQFNNNNNLPATLSSQSPPQVTYQTHATSQQQPVPQIPTISLQPPQMQAKPHQVVQQQTLMLQHQSTFPLSQTTKMAQSPQTHTVSKTPRMPPRPTTVNQLGNGYSQHNIGNAQQMFQTSQNLNNTQLSNQNAFINEPKGKPMQQNPSIASTGPVSLQPKQQSQPNFAAKSANHAQNSNSVTSRMNNNQMFSKQLEIKNKLSNLDAPDGKAKVQHPKYPMYNTDTLTSKLPAAFAAGSSTNSQFSTNNYATVLSNLNKPFKPQSQHQYAYTPITLAPNPNQDSATSFLKKPTQTPVYPLNPSAPGPANDYSQGLSSFNPNYPSSISSLGLNTSSSNSNGLPKSSTAFVSSISNVPGSLSSLSSNYPSLLSVGNPIGSYSGITYAPTLLESDAQGYKPSIATKDVLPSSTVNNYQSISGIVNSSKEFVKDEVNKSYNIDSKPILQDDKQTPIPSLIQSESNSTDPGSRQNSIIYNAQPPQLSSESGEPEIQYNNTQDQDQRYLLNYDMESSNSSSVDMNINSANNITAGDSYSMEQYQGTPKRSRPAGLPKIHSVIAEVSESENTPSERGDDEGFIDGYVTEEYEVGSRYEGYKKNGMRNGKGKFYYQDGGYYEGDWKDNKMHGEGKLYYNENKIAYEGEWYMDEFHGHGKVYNDEPVPLLQAFDYSDFQQIEQYWEYYEGNLQNDTKEGQGKLVLSNGQIYEGEFRHDKIWGKGKFYTQSGEVVAGEWVDSKLMQRIFEKAGGDK